jgi:transposase InsO family protein
MDFMHDTLYHGKRFRTLNVIDEGVREALAIEVDTSLPAERVIRVLEQLKESRPLPRQIRVDNGPELISAKLIAWCDNHQIRLHHIQPGKPMQNGYIERFNKSFRNEVLDANLFGSLSEVREAVHQWMTEYNEERPHKSLGNLPCMESRPICQPRPIQPSRANSSITSIGMVAATGHEVLRPSWSGSKSMAAPHECFDGRLPPRMGRGL